MLVFYPHNASTIRNAVGLAVRHPGRVSHVRLPENVLNLFHVFNEGTMVAEPRPACDELPETYSTMTQEQAATATAIRGAAARRAQLQAASPRQQPALAEAPPNRKPAAQAAVTTFTPRNELAAWTLIAHCMIEVLSTSNATTGFAELVYAQYIMYATTEAPQGETSHKHFGKLIAQIDDGVSIPGFAQEQFCQKLGTASRSLDNAQQYGTMLKQAEGVPEASRKVRVFKDDPADPPDALIVFHQAVEKYRGSSFATCKSAKKRARPTAAAAASATAATAASAATDAATASAAAVARASARAAARAAKRDRSPHQEAPPQRGHRAERAPHLQHGESSEPDDEGSGSDDQ